MLQSQSVLGLAALVFSFSAGAFGCAASASEATESGAEQALIDTAGTATFKLYDVAGHSPDATCDVYTQLVLSTTDGALRGRAELSPQVEGVCKPGFGEGFRRYELLASDDDCGSHVWTGTAKASGKVREITITDHRSRTCRDLVPAMIIVEERALETESASSLFSFDG